MPLMLSIPFPETGLALITKILADDPSLAPEHLAKYKRQQAAILQDPNARVLDANNAGTNDWALARKLEWNATTNALLGRYPLMKMIIGHGQQLTILNEFGTEAYKQAIENAAHEARDEFDGFFDDTDPMVPPTLNPEKSPELATLDLLDNGPGVCMGVSHTDPSSKDFLINNMDALLSKKVKVLFIEEIMAFMQPELNAYFEDRVNMPLSHVNFIKLKDYLDGVDSTLSLKGKSGSFIVLVEKAKEKGMWVYGVNSDIDTGFGNATPLYTLRRTATMNKKVAEVVETAMQEMVQRGEADAKYMMHLGTAHVNSHPGGLPGLSQLLGIPSIEVIRGEFTPIADDPSNWEGPSSEELAFIENKYRDTGGPQGDLRIALNVGTMEARHELYKAADNDAYNLAKQEFDRLLVLLKAGSRSALKNKAQLFTQVPKLEDKTLIRDQMRVLQTQILEAQQAAADALRDALALNPKLLHILDGEGRTLFDYALGTENDLACKEIIKVDRSFAYRPNKEGLNPIDRILASRDFTAAPLLEEFLTEQYKHQSAILGDLLNNGASPYTEDKDGMTALHKAARIGNDKAATLLVDKGANPYKKDNRGWTPMDVCIASGKPKVEKALLAKGVKAKEIVSLDRSVAQILADATLCEDPAQQKNILGWLEKLYADPLLRPILELAAVDAAQPRVPGEDGGVRLFVAKGEHIGGLYAPPSYIQTPGRGGYDADANVFDFSSGGEDGASGGTFIHEMTHMVVRKLFGRDTVPFGNDDEKDKYREAIEADVLNMATMVPLNPAEARLKERLCDRMDTYAKRAGDEELLQEFIVSIPQIIAEYGGEVVAKYAPNLMAFFGDFTKKCTKKIKDTEAYSDIFDWMKNDELLEKVKTIELPTSSEWIATPDNAQDIAEQVIKQFALSYKIEHGQVKRSSGGETLLWSPEQYELNGPDQNTLNLLTTQLRPLLKRGIESGPKLKRLSCEDLRNLAADLTELHKGGNIAHADKYTAKWLREAQIHECFERLESGAEVFTDELAEVVVLMAENEAWNRVGSKKIESVVKIDDKTHKSLVEKLTEDFNKQPIENLRKLSEEKLRSFAANVVDTAGNAFKVKYALIWTNPDHLSIDVRQARIAWLNELAKL